MSDEERDQQEQEQDGKFKVSDRRLFTADGEPVKRASSEEEEEKPQESPHVEMPDPEEAARSATARQPEGEQEIDFSSFALSLATSAMAYMGEVPDPASGKTVENLEGAKQMIDILHMLKEKTEGNLEQEEEMLLENILYELRMKYLSKKKIVKL